MIEKLDSFFTDLFSKLQETVSLSTLFVLLAGIVIGFVICSSIYSILLIKSVDKQEKTLNIKQVDDLLIKKIVDETKNSFVDESIGLSVKERFEVLGKKIQQEVYLISSNYYPNSKYPLYEITIEEATLFLHYLSNRIDDVFNHPILKPFKNLNISTIFNIIDTKKKLDDKKIVKTAKKVNSVKNVFLNIAKIFNVVSWVKKLVVGSTINYSIRKISLIIIDIVAEEAVKTYSKSIFDKEKSIRLLEIEQVLNDLEMEGSNG